MKPNILLIIFIIITFFILLKIFKIYKESFVPSENDYNYIPIGKKYCLLTKEITKNGGIYKSKLKNGVLPKVFNNQKIVLIDEEFTEDNCVNKTFGSGRQRGGFVCMDFITEKIAKKYNLEYSKKTCYDPLPFIPIFPVYTKLLESFSKL